MKKVTGVKQYQKNPTQSMNSHQKTQEYMKSESPSSIL